MRVLVATTAGSGHFGPMLPFARAVRERGHVVEVAAPASFGHAVARAGFTHLPFPDVPDDTLGAVYATLPGRPEEEVRALVLGDIFGRLNTAAALPAMKAIVAEYRPDIVVREICELSSYLVADALGIPHVQIEIGLASFHDVADAHWEAPLLEFGAPPGLAGLESAPRLSLTPPSFEDPAAPGRPDTARFRDGAAAPSPAAMPDWWTGNGDPLVYVTFGSVAAGREFFPGFYRTVIDALSDVPVRVLLTVGDGADISLLGPLPANIHVERWWPQDHVLGFADAMVGHGGFGTTLAGLTAGTPMVVLPLFADQPDNARRVAELGAGVALDGGPDAAGRLPEALTRVLDDPTYRASARRVADEIAGLPPASAAVPLLEAMAGTTA